MRKRLKKKHDDTHYKRALSVIWVLKKHFSFKGSTFIYLNQGNKRKKKCFNKNNLFRGKMVKEIINGETMLIVELKKKKKM